jgi:hypothetical protein
MAGTIGGFKHDPSVKSQFSLPWREGMKRMGMDKALKSFHSSPPPQPSPIKKEGFFPFYEFIKHGVWKAATR